MIYKLSKNQYLYLNASYLHIDTGDYRGLFNIGEWSDLVQREIIKHNKAEDRYYLTFRGVWVLYLYGCNV